MSQSWLELTLGDWEAMKQIGSQDIEGKRGAVHIFGDTEDEEMHGVKGK